MVDAARIALMRDLKLCGSRSSLTTISDAATARPAPGADLVGFNGLAGVASRAPQHREAIRRLQEPTAQRPLVGKVLKFPLWLRSRIDKKSTPATRLEAGGEALPARLQSRG